MRRILGNHYVWIGLAILVAALLPLVMHSNQYAMVLMTTVLFYAVLASAWNIIGGMAGQLDLAAGAYVGLGAFTTGTLLLRWNVTPWLGMPLGGVVAMGFALLIGLPLFRFKVKELWYALSSSAMVEVLRIVFLMWDEIGGPSEKYLPGLGSNPWYSLRFSTYMPYYFIVLVGLIAVIYLNHHIRNSHLGYSLLALGEDEDAAEVLGVDARNNKLKALMIYSFIAGAAGGLYACMYGFLHPSFFSTEISTEVAILGIVGGMGITFGPLIAAIFLVSGREYLRAALGGELAGLYLAVYAVILILVALFQPRGIALLLKRFVDRISVILGVKKDEFTAETSGQ